MAMAMAMAKIYSDIDSYSLPSKRKLAVELAGKRKQNFQTSLDLLSFTVV